MKNKKLIGLASLMLVLGATGCPKKDCGEGNHTWGDEEVVTAATCTEAGKGKKVCTVCGAEEETTIKKTGHKYKDDATGLVAATCTTAGSKTQTCENCGDKKTVAIPATGHKWVKAEGGTEPTCTEVGSENQVCSVCNATQAVEVPAKGHTYGDWTTVEGKAATCTAAGEEQHICSVCNNVETREVAALGHKPQLTEGSDVTAPPGKAAVRIYECANGCGQKFLGFKASEVSEASKEHLNFTEPNEKGEVGASFWGRPIGNSLALNADGSSVNRKNNEVVYCSTETGDFFEYVFDLDADQVALLGACRCYCDAKPADYLNGGDFWAYNASSDDWTPGYYIDGGAGHYEMDGENPQMVQDHTRCEKGSASEGDPIPDSSVKMGKRITDYRYILYFNDEPVEFDPDTKVPTEGSNTDMKRKEYVMPYTFNFKVGTNKISLRMAGGYRSTFYNFTFRPYVAPTPITVNESTLEVREGNTVAITGASQEGVTYTSSNTNVATVDANGVVTGVKAGTATITVSKEGNFKDAKVAVTVTEKLGVIKVEAESGVVEGGNITTRVPSGGASGSMIDAFPKDEELTLTINNEGAAGEYDMVMVARSGGSNITLTDVMTMKLNGADLDLTGKAVTSGYSMGDTDLGKVTLNAGANTLVIKHTGDGNMPNLDYFKFTPASGEEVPPQPVHEHTWTAAADPQEDEVASVVSTCSCGVEQIRWDANKVNAASKNAKTNQDAVDGKKGVKLDGDCYNKTKGTASEGAHADYKVNVPAAKTGAKLLIKGARTSSAAPMFSKVDNDNSKSYYEAEAGAEWVRYPWRYKLIVNGVDVPFDASVFTTENPEPTTGSNEIVEREFPCTFDLVEGENTIQLQKWGGYTFIITELALVY